MSNINTLSFAVATRLSEDDAQVSTIVTVDLAGCQPEEMIRAHTKSNSLRVWVQAKLRKGKTIPREYTVRMRDYLDGTREKRVEVRPMTFEELSAAVDAGTIDKQEVAALLAKLAGTASE